MLGRTAGGLFWMFRYLERSENMARLVQAGHQMALTSLAEAEGEWESVLTTVGIRASFMEQHDQVDTSSVTNFLLRDKSNPSSIISMIRMARDNARMVRTALTREAWEATNECWIALSEAMARPIRERDLPDVLGLIRRQSALVRGATHGTMLRNDIYNFARLGTFLERADNTARILDVKYFLLLPSASYVGSPFDNMQWETILRSVSADRSYHWLNGGDVDSAGIADFLIFDRRLPRSLTFCYANVCDNLNDLAREYGSGMPSQELGTELDSRLADQDIDGIFDTGLHEFLIEFLGANGQLGQQIEQDFRFFE